MRISLTIPNNHRVKALLQPWQDEVGGPQIAEVAALADRLGYRRLTVAEHFLIPAEHVGLSGPHHLHAVTSLAYLAGVTSRIRLASNVTILPLGVDFTTRGRRLDECVEAMRRIWTSDLASYDGEFFRFHEIAAEPKPRQPGGVALWFAGDVPQTFARVARWGVGWSPYLLPPTRIAEGLDRIRSHPGYHGQPIGVFYNLANLRLSAGHVGKADDHDFDTWDAQRMIDQLGWIRDLGVTEVTPPLPRLRSYQHYLERLHWVAEEVMTAVA